MYDFRSIHVGKDFYRAKSKEEDITIINEISKVEFPVSLKAYGDGPLQLSTDKSSLLFSLLSKRVEDETTSASKIHDILGDAAFLQTEEINVLPLIYDEKKSDVTFLFLITLVLWQKFTQYEISLAETAESTLYTCF